MTQLTRPSRLWSIDRARVALSWWRGRRGRRVAGWVAVALVLYTFFGFFLVPVIIRHIIIPEIGDRLNGSISLRHARFNPYSLALTLEFLEVQDSNGVKVFAFERFDGNFQILSTIFRSGYHFHQAEVTRPFVFAHLSKEGRVNLIELIKPIPRPDKPKPLKKIPRVVVKQTGVADATVSLRDDTPVEPFIKIIEGLDFDLDDLDTRPENENPHKLTATTDAGEQVEWQGTVFVDPLTSRGSLKVTGIDLPRFMPYAMPFTTGRLTGGTLNAELSYDFAPARKPRRAAVTVTSANIADFAIEHEEQTVVEWKDARVANVQADAQARTVSIALVAVDGCRVRAARDENGVVTATRLPIVPEARAAAAPASPAAAVPDPDTIETPIEKLIASTEGLIQNLVGPWSLAVEKLEVADTSLEFRDRSTTPPVEASVTGIRLVAGPIRSDEGFKIPFDVALTFQETGKLAAVGQVLTPERAVDLSAKATGLSLAFAAPYVPRELPAPLPPAVLKSANVSFDGRLQAGDAGTDGRRASWSGSFILDSLRVDDAAAATPMASLERLTITGDAEVQVQGLDTGTLAWTGSTQVESISAEAPVSGPVKFSCAAVNVEGRLGVSIAPKTPPDASFDGTARVGDVKLDAPEILGTEFALGSAVVAGVAFQESGKRLAVSEVIVDSPNARLATALVPTEVPKEKAPAPDAKPRFQPPKLPYDVRIGSITVSNGAVEVRDEKARPPAVISIDEIAVQLSNLGSDGESVAELTYTSRVQGSGRVKVTGKVDAFRPAPFADMVVSLTGLPLKPYDAMTGWYIGYLVESGRLTMTLPIKVQEGKLKGNLDFNFDRFYLGKSVDSPAAPDVPVKLGLSLLRDLDEQISGSVSLSGDMLDPSFSFGGLIWKAFLNLLLKAATAPFQVLGALFGGGDDVDLSMVEFEPGVTELTHASMTSLDALTRAMTQRPALKLQATGRCEFSVDEPALRRIILREQALARTQRVKTWIVSLTQELYQSAVELQFREHFGNDALVVQTPRGEQPLTFDEIEMLVLATIEVPGERFDDLARRRAETVFKQLTDGGVPPDRVTTKAPTGKEVAADSPRVEFELE